MKFTIQYFRKGKRTKPLTFDLASFDQARKVARIAGEFTDAAVHSVTITSEDGQNRTMGLPRRHLAAAALMSKLGNPKRHESEKHCPDDCPAQADDRPRRRSTQRHGRDYPFDDIRDAIRAVMRLSFHRLVQRGYAPDGAQTVLMRMTRGIIGHLDDEQRRRVG